MHCPVYVVPSCGWENMSTVAAVTKATIGNPPDVEPATELLTAHSNDPDLAIVRSWLEEGAQAPDLVNVLLWESERGRFLAATREIGQTFYHVFSRPILCHGTRLPGSRRTCCS